MKKSMIVMILVFGIIFYLSSQPISSITELWPLLLLLCPIMYMFMHGGHKHSKESNNE